ncbi:MAG: methyl-accepting chemotaxis protein [Deltaproteobacteria bacterium]|nr:methyl-accepting chemotaxis protein [Deltaproteobacteria bacterium]
MIKLHGDFQVKKAYQLMYGASQDSHKEISELIHSKAQQSKENSDKELKDTENMATADTKKITSIALTLAVFLAVLFSMIISLPIRRSVTLIQKLAQGDLTLDKRLKEIKVENLQKSSSNELKLLSRSTSYMLLRLRGMIGLITKKSNIVTSSVPELSSTSGALVDNVTRMNEQAGLVAERSDQLLSTINTIASSTEEFAATSS